MSNDPKALQPVNRTLDITVPEQALEALLIKVGELSMSFDQHCLLRQAGETILNEFQKLYAIDAMAGALQQESQRQAGELETIRNLLAQVTAELEVFRTRYPGHTVTASPIPFLPPLSFHHFPLTRGDE